MLLKIHILFYRAYAPISRTKNVLLCARAIVCKLQSTFTGLARQWPRTGWLAAGVIWSHACIGSDG